MSRRGRAIAFLAVSLLCAGLAAALAGGYGRSVSEQLGELRAMVVAAEDLPARHPLTPRVLREALEVRRVPERFVPAGALAAPGQALGRSPVTRISAGSYLMAEQFRSPRPKRRPEPAIGAGRSPLEIQVVGAASISAIGPAERRRVDVVVTTEPGPGGRGRTFVAARGVPLISLVEAGGEPSLPGAAALPSFVATLAVTRPEALRLIDAQNFARELRLIPG